LEECTVRKTHLVMLAIVAAATVLAIGAVSAYASLASDTNAPTTATDVAATYWNDVTITATATDDEGIAYVYHELDEGVVRLATIAGKPLSTQITIPTRLDDPLAAGIHKLKYWAQDINGNVEAQHVVTFTVGSDTGKPVTTVSGATDGAWYKAGMTVHLAAADGAGESGIKELSYALDGAAATVVAAEGDVAVPAIAGPHAIAYHATDVAGNVEADRTFTVNVDTSKPVTSAVAASVVKGRTVKLKYRVAESGPSAGKAAVVIKVKNRRGRVVKTIKASQVTVNAAVSAKFRCKLAVGVYTYTVFATDAAGNAQSKAGSAKLIVM
jgi:cytochrome c